jgi:hypothetical protein
MVDRDHNDRRGSRRPHCRLEINLRPAGEDRVDASANEFRSHFGKASSVAAEQLRPVDQIAAQVSPLLVTELVQSLFEGATAGPVRKNHDHAEAKDSRRLVGRPLWPRTAATLLRRRVTQAPLAVSFDDLVGATLHFP